jgi:hypothetical protein
MQLVVYTHTHTINSMEIRTLKHVGIHNILVTDIRLIVTVIIIIIIIIITTTIIIIIIIYVILVYFSWASRHEGVSGEVAFMNSALDGSEWSA